MKWYRIRDDTSKGILMEVVGWEVWCFRQSWLINRGSIRRPLKARYGSLAIYVASWGAKEWQVGKKPVSSVRVSVVGESTASVNTWSIFFFLITHLKLSLYLLNIWWLFALLQILLPGNHSIFCGFPLALTRGGWDILKSFSRAYFRTRQRYFPMNFLSVLLSLAWEALIENKISVKILTQTRYYFFLFFLIRYARSWKPLCCYNTYSRVRL